jgi:hypothetical protein
VAVALTENMHLTETNTDTTSKSDRKHIILNISELPVMISDRYLTGVLHKNPLKPNDVIQLD